MTRIIDIFISILAIILFSPFLPIIAFFIKIDSQGPVFYTCKRVGQHGKIFKVYKFRTMYETKVQIGPSVSPQGDPRVTPVGRVLRRLKLNEFPQFYNVLKGDMTLVGPRPEAPELAALYPEEAKVIFTVKPGLAGPSQILGRNEEELYPPGADPAQFYLEHILPNKIPLDIQYIMDKSLVKNLKYIYLAVKVTVTGTFSRRYFLDNLSQFFLLGCDMLLCLLSFTLAHAIRFEGWGNPSVSTIFWRILPWTVALRLPIFLYFGLYNVLIRHLSLFDIKRVIYAVTCSSIVLISCSFLFGHTFTYSRGIFLIDWCLLISLLICYRVVLKRVHQHRSCQNRSLGRRQKVLIWGAGDCGELCLRYLKNGQASDYEVMGFIDDDPKKRGKRIGGVKILGDRHHLPVLVQLYKIEKVFVAITSVAFSEVEKITRMGAGLNLKIEIFQPTQRTPDTPSSRPPDQSLAGNLKPNHSLSAV